MIEDLRQKIKCKPNKTFYILSGGFESFSKKFPYMCINNEIRSAVDRHKFLTLYPNCVIENQLYIGSGIQAKNWKIIRDLKITHIINASVEHECVFENELKYLHVRIEDSYHENIYDSLIKSYEFMQDAFSNYEKDKERNDGRSSSASSTEESRSNTQTSTRSRRPVFLIHCNLGISRSSSILIAYLIAKYKLCLYSSFNFVKDKRLQIAPNYSFLRQLKQFEENYY